MRGRFRLEIAVRPIVNKDDNGIGVATLILIGRTNFGAASSTMAGNDEVHFFAHTDTAPSRDHP